MATALDRLQDERRDPGSSEALLDAALVDAQASPSCTEEEMAASIVAYGDARVREAAATATAGAGHAEVTRLGGILEGNGIARRT